MIKGNSKLLHIICLLLDPNYISQYCTTMEGKVVDCDWGKNGEDEPALWEDWMMGDNENDSQEVPMGLFDDWDPEIAMNAVAGGNQNDSQEGPMELFDDWDVEDEMRAGTVRPKKDHPVSGGRQEERDGTETYDLCTETYRAWRQAGWQARDVTKNFGLQKREEVKSRKGFCCCFTLPLLLHRCDGLSERGKQWFCLCNLFPFSLSPT